MAIKKFKVDITEFSEKEKILFEKLILAAELIDPLYQKQKNERYPGANFYPHDASKEEIEQTAKKNPKILDPYTFVERNKSGKLIAIPFHKKFRKELKPINKLLNEAAKLTEDSYFEKYLKHKAKSLLRGRYQESEIIWLAKGPCKLSIVIGPIERYLDKLFFKKCAYQAWVGILNKKKTNEATKIKNIVLISQRKVLPESKKIDVAKLAVRIDKAAIFSGLIADFMFTGTSLPNDVNLIEKYGSVSTVFETSLDEKFGKDQFPIFQAVFDKDFQKSYSKEELYEASLRCVLLHEISHALMYYKDAEDRLKDLFPVVEELFGYILGIKCCGPLLLKGVISQKELEAILIMHICRNFTWWLDSLKDPDVSVYATGAAIAQNFFFREKAIKTKEGISWPDFTKLFICVDELSHVLEYHLALGSYQETKKFIEKYGSFNIFSQFSKQLESVLRK